MYRRSELLERLRPAFARFALHFFLLGVDDAFADDEVFVVVGAAASSGFAEVAFGLATGAAVECVDVLEEPLGGGGGEPEELEPEPQNVITRSTLSAWHWTWTWLSLGLKKAVGQFGLSPVDHMGR
jgi:hypothetical protein